MFGALDTPKRCPNLSNDPVLPILFVICDFVGQTIPIDVCGDYDDDDDDDDDDDEGHVLKGCQEREARIGLWSPISVDSTCPLYPICTVSTPHSVHIAQLGNTFLVVFYY